MNKTMKKIIARKGLDGENRRSKGIAVFCWILLFYASLTMLWYLSILIIARFPLSYLPKAIAQNGLAYILTLFVILIAISLLRLSNMARRIFIILAVVLTISSISTSVAFSKRYVPQALEEFNQQQVERYEQKGETPQLLPTPVVYLVFSIFFNLPRVVWIVIFVSGIILFTRPNIKEQFISSAS